MNNFYISLSSLGLGGAGGDATKFGIREIPMIFANETAPINGSYDFFFYVHAPDTPGTYTPQYQANASSGTFGEVASATVNVVENPFHPVTQPDGSKLYTTPFGNDETNISVSIVGPRVYIENFHVSSVEDPRFRINPSLKSGVFDLELNDTFSYADVTIPYDPAKVTYTANLSLAYYNGTSGNYTFVASTVDTTNKTVTARVSDSSIFSHGASFAALDRLKYQALPANAQTEMGYFDISAVDNWTIHDTNLRTTHTTWYYGMREFAPGNYTIVPSGYYHHIELMGYCGFEKNAWENYGGTGPYVSYTRDTGATSAMVSTLVVPDGSHYLKFNHTGGAIGISIIPVASTACGDLTYKVYYGEGPVFRDGDMTYGTELNNTAFNRTGSGYDLAVLAYQAAAGCVLGQAGKKGGVLDSAHNLIPGWSDAINDDVTESPAYLVGHVACAIAFPEYALARDFLADLARGDPIAAALDSLGYIGPVKNLLRTTDVIPVFLLKNSADSQAATKLIKYLADEGLIGSSHDEIIEILDKVFDGSASRLYDPGKNSADDLLNAATKEFDLKTIRSVQNLNGKTRVLTNQRYNHIFDRHVTGAVQGSGRIETTFFPMGYEVRPSVWTPNIMSETDLNMLLWNCQKYGTPSDEFGDIVYRWNPDAFGITDMKIVIRESTGEIVTAYPVDGPNVIRSL